MILTALEQVEHIEDWSCLGVPFSTFVYIDLASVVWENRALNNLNLPIMELGESLELSLEDYESSRLPIILS